MGRVKKLIEFFKKPRNRNILTVGNLFIVSIVFVSVSDTFAVIFLSSCILPLSFTALVYMIFFEKSRESLEKELLEALKQLLEGNYQSPIATNWKGDLTESFLALERLRFKLLQSNEHGIVFQQKTKTMLANVTHDLKTPLSVISGCAECIADGLYDKNYPAMIGEQIALMSQLISEIVESAREELSALPEPKTETNFRLYFDKERASLKNLVEKSGRRFKSGRAPDLLIFMESRQISRVFENIVGNAIKFTKERDKISIKFSKTKKRLRITVTDTGIGIEKEDIPFIFDRFYRCEKSRSTKGTGLGLAISKEIVEKHGGKIFCKGDRRKGGTAFSFTLPVLPKKNLE